MAATLTCIIIDDDALSRKVLEKYVEQTDFLTLVASCGDAIEAGKILRERPVDVFLLDVEMPGMSGLDFIQTLDYRPEIILITSKEEYAASAFDLEVLDYIVKPAAYPRFLKAANKAFAKMGTRPVSSDNPASKLFVKSESQWIGIEIGEILYVEALADYVKIHTREKRYTVYSSMKGIESRLPESHFMRVHRSYIINLDKITAIDGNTVSLGDHLIPVGVTYQKKLMDRLNML